MDTKSVIARFEAERQALALMDHHNIAKVHDAGATETGRPYFVMELVRGVKITDYCDEKNLSTQERLELFTQVCHAIQHAHQKGIIHRDIKPSNILVTVIDGVAVPKVIDFGIAKATNDQRLTDMTVFTAFDQFIGTPAYMSPEQAEISGVDVDTRSDIYSLGVLLYELLTGQTPFDARELLQAGLDEMRRTLREKEPQRPSTRVSTLGGEELTTTAKRRGLEAPKLVNVLRGDLDWIVMKCLEKDRARRYETANGLASDIQRHLSNEPVVACPPSAAYKFQKLVRRNKLAFAAGAGIAAALVIGLAIALWQSIEKTRAYREQARLRQQAQTEAAKSQQVAQFLQEMLQSVGPSVALGRDTKLLREILQKTALRLNDLTNQPAVEAHLRTILGAVYGELDEHTNAVAMHQRALALRKLLHGDAHPDVALSLFFLADELLVQGKLSEAETMHRDALAMRKKFLGNEHPDVAASLNNLANVLQHESKLEEAERIQREALAMQRKLLGDETQSVADSLHNLALVLKRQGKLAESETMYREALALTQKLLGNEHPAVADCLASLGQVLSAQGKLTVAEAMHRDALAMRKRLFGNEHHLVANSLNALAATLLAQDKLAEAESMFAEALATYRKVFDAEHREVQSVLNNLAQVLVDQNKLIEAETMNREALAMARKLLGNQHPDVATSLNNLGLLLRKQGKQFEAEKSYREALEIKRDPATLNNLARLLQEQGKLPDAASLLRECVDFVRKQSGDATTEGYLDLARVLPSLASVLLELGQLAEARSAAEEATGLCRLHSNWSVHVQDFAFYTLGMVCVAQGNVVEAEEVQSEHLAMLRKRAPGIHKIGGALAELTVTLLAEQKFPEAEATARECLEFRQKHFPDAWHIFSARALLGESLLGQKRYAEAEPLLLSAYEGMEQRKDQIPSGSGGAYRRQPRLKKALELLVLLYEETGRGIQAAQWKAKLTGLDRELAEEHMKPAKLSPK